MNSQCGHKFMRFIRERSSPKGKPRGIITRWLKFNAVGALGIGVQLLVLACLKSGLHIGYLLATGIAVEAAVVHNFLWHERYTWRERIRPSCRKSLPRFFRFNLSNGAISIAGNLALMKTLVDLVHVHYLIANAIAITACSLLNFVVSEEWVFAPASNAMKKNPPLPGKVEELLPANHDQGGARNAQGAVIACEKRPPTLRKTRRAGQLR